MNVVDAVLIVILAAFALRGYWRGFFREAFGVLALVAGVAAAVQWSAAAAVLVEEHIPVPPIAYAGVAFVGIFVVVYSVVNVLGVVLHRLAGGSRWLSVARAGGVVLGLAKGGVVLAVVLLFLHLLPVVPEANVHLRGSKIARPLVTAASNVLRAGVGGVQAEAPSRS